MAPLWEKCIQMWGLSGSQNVLDLSRDVANKIPWHQTFPSCEFTFAQKHIQQISHSCLHGGLLSFCQWNWINTLHGIHTYCTERKRDFISLHNPLYPTLNKEPDSKSFEEWFGYHHPVVYLGWPIRGKTIAILEYHKDVAWNLVLAQLSQMIEIYFPNLDTHLWYNWQMKLIFLWPSLPLNIYSFHEQQTEAKTEAEFTGEQIVVTHVVIVTLTLESSFQNQVFSFNNFRSISRGKRKMSIFIYFF